jgi:hypothetical protein
MYSDSVIDKCLLFALSNRGDTGKQGEIWATIFFKFSNSFVCGTSWRCCCMLSRLRVFIPLFLFNYFRFLSHIDQAYFSFLSSPTVAAAAAAG